MAVTRLYADERRKAIVASAIPLFARKGFAGTTTKELAETAGISEALLFRHFPSKKQLYEEILRSGCEGDTALECLVALQPSWFILRGIGMKDAAIIAALGACSENPLGLVAD